MIAALYKNKIPDYITLFVALIGVSIPAFVIGTLFQYFVGYKLSDVLQSITGIEYRLFPITGWGSFRHSIIPSLALAFGVMGIIIKTMRSSMIEVMNQNYIITARAKGLTERQTILRHAFKNAVLPVISVLGPLITSIIMGSFVIENIFSIPGLGQYFVNSVKSKDYTMVLGLSVFTAFISITLNTLTDILYMFVYPRIRIYKREK
jgi:ABC-type dipeptide/oligopeptide/nickel transport system permease component